MGIGSSSAAKLGDRVQEFPLSLTAPANIIALQSVPERHLGIIEQSGRVCQMDYNKTVVGWVDSQGNAYRNDFNKTKVGWIDLKTKEIYQADYANTKMGRVDNDGRIFSSSDVAHKTLTGVTLGKIDGPEDSFAFAACAFLLLF